MPHQIGLRSLQLALLSAAVGVLTASNAFAQLDPKAVVYQTPEHSRTAFGGLVKQEDASLGARRQPFSRELRVLELVLNLDRALQRV